MFYPWLVFFVSASFSVTVFWQYQQRHRLYQAIWALALAMAAGGTLSYIICLSTHTELSFRLYYILGALLMPIYLGMGSLLLAARSSSAIRRARITLYILLLASVVAVVTLLLNPINSQALQHLNSGNPAGTGIYKPGPYLLCTIVFNTLGVLWVVGVALYSGLQRWRRQAFGRLVGANLLIASGDLIIGAAGSFARLGDGSVFWVIMAIGWIIIFSGFLLTFTLHTALSFPSKKLSRAVIQQS